MTDVDQNDNESEDDLDRWVKDQKPPAPSSGFLNRCLATIPGTVPAARGAVADDAMSRHSPIVIDTSVPSPSHVRTSRLFDYFSQVGPFSYTVSAILMCIAVLGAWQYKMADRVEQSKTAQTHRDAGEVARNSEASLVACVTAIADCQWAGVSSAGEKDGRETYGSDLTVASMVFMGRQIRLDSGLFEITYKTGASVILQGPATFQVEANGGFLAVGKLTGKLNKKAGKPNPESPIPNPSLPFAIRTPTAVVTDLGTEFGVEVGNDGRTTSYVFRGSVRLHPATAADSEHDIVLKKNEAICTESNDPSQISFRRIQVEPKRFVRRIGNGRTPIEAFSTGIDFERLGNDRHWQVVAVSGLSDYVPEPAKLVATLPSWTVNGPGQPQWIGAFAGPADALPAGTVCTFRTTFDLDDVVLEAAVLHCHFLTNGHVNAIRLNGASVPVPAHDKDAYSLFHSFSLDRGFVDGANALEFDISKADRSESAGGYVPQVSLRADLEGTVQER